MRRIGGMLLACAMLAAGLSGCVMGRVFRDHPLDESHIRQIERGVTSKAQILEQFGPPQEIEAREIVAVGAPFESFLSRRGERPPVERLVSARFFRYTFARANAFGIITLLFNYLEFDQKSDTLVVFFDGENKVEDYAYAKDSERLPRFGFWSR